MTADVDARAARNPGPGQRRPATAAVTGLVRGRDGARPSAKARVTLRQILALRRLGCPGGVLVAIVLVVATAGWWR